MTEKDVQEREIENPENGNFDINADETMQGSTHLNEPVSEGEDDLLAKAKEELQESKDKYLRLAAEFDNFRRRSAKERIELMQTAGKEVILELLTVLDDTDRAQKQLETTTDVDQLKQGVTLVFNKFRNTLQSKGLKAMETVGSDFDADLHEAITEIPAGTEEMKGKVVDEVVKGYYLNDKLIRHAKVVVGK
jgi:molecular chaperone GrpE